MSLYELPEPLLKAIVDAGLKTAWKESLSLPSAEARYRAKVKIQKQARMYRGKSVPDAAETAARMFTEVGPLLAEHEAISKAAQKFPILRNAAPEILTEDEAVALMEADNPYLTTAEKSLLRVYLGNMLKAKTPIMKLTTD